MSAGTILNYFLDGRCVAKPRLFLLPVVHAHHVHRISDTWHAEH